MGPKKGSNNTLLLLKQWPFGYSMYTVIELYLHTWSHDPVSGLDIVKQVRRNMH